jgi:hypothetical protein
MLANDWLEEEPILSILLMKHNFGILFFVAWAHTFCVWASTPLTPSIIVTTPSKTLKLLVT